MDLQKLTKLMNLTLSDNDNEALGAMRKANEIVRDAGQMWNSMLKCPGEKFCTHAKPAEPVETKKNVVTIAEMFDYLLGECDELNSGTVHFLESIQAFHEDHGYLSDKQYDILRKIYDDNT